MTGLRSFRTLALPICNSRHLTQHARHIHHTTRTSQAKPATASPPISSPPTQRHQHENLIYPQRKATVDTHTMGTSLNRYLAMKVHQSVLERAYPNGITITGAYSRTHPSSILFSGEKTDKPFNWQRPTARLSSCSSRLYIDCFPGYDHVEHYAEIIATYLSLQANKNLTCPAKVNFIPSSCSDTQTALLESNLSSLPPNIDTVVLGLVHRLQALTGPAKWNQQDGSFAWTVQNFPRSSKNVAFIGFRPSFWGDISGEVVHFLASRLGVKEVLYFGKLGSVRPGVKPNTWLATGGKSIVRGQTVEWENILQKSVEKLAEGDAVVGTHVTLGSVLHETRDWLASLPASVDFVDPEVGMMAQAAVRSGVRFGYLHIISDNVAEKYEEDLSNERMESVLERRGKLYRLVQDVLGDYLSHGN
ncbi:hypothetical protein QBC44DRAFT_253240 [Cladorrhinum sp. PSN332]|nr:hypothetical protein QBC44DRAFT_253240 [Cladorrhinum sp. PSN332]